MIFLFQGWILRFHVNLPGCIQQTKLPGSVHHEAPPGPSEWVSQHYHWRCHGRFHRHQRTMVECDCTWIFVSTNCTRLRGTYVSTLRAGVKLNVPEKNLWRYKRLIFVHWHHFCGGENKKRYLILRYSHLGWSASSRQDNISWSLLFDGVISIASYFLVESTNALSSFTFPLDWGFHCHNLR